MAVFSAIASWVTSFVFQAAIGAGVGFTTAAAVATGLGSLASGLVAAGVSRLLQPKVSVPRQTVQALIEQTDEPRRIYVGQNLVGGLRAFFDVKGSTLFQIVVVAHGHVSEFRRFFVDGKPVTLDANGNVIGNSPTADHLAVATRDGTGNGGNYGQVLNNFSSWNASRRLQHQATFMVRADATREIGKIFPKGSQTSFQWEIRGRRIYDPRTGLTEYSANAANVIAHYVTDPDGGRIASDEISWPSVSAMADVADTMIPQLGGGTAPSLRLWGYWTLDEPPSDVLDRMHTSSGIRVYEMQDGKLGLIGGPYGEPACTITAKDIRSIQTSDAISEREGYNVLRMFWISAAQKYEKIEAEPWRDAVRLAEEGEIVSEYHLDMCPNQSQARRLGKEQIFDDNRAKVEIVTNLVGLKARYPRLNGQRHTILLDYRPEDGSGRVIAGEYEVLNHDFDPVAMECRIELARVSRASQTWSAAEEGSTVAELPDDEGNPAPPMSAALSQRVIQVSASVRQAVLEVAAIAVTGRDDLTIEAQYRRTGTGAWTDMSATNLLATSGAVEDGQQYEAQVRWRGVFDGVAPWVALGPVTVRIDGTAPGQPTEIMPGGVRSITWRNPTTGFYGIRVYRSITNVLSDAVFIYEVTGGASGQISEYRDEAASAGTYFYWVRAANVSGLESPPAGPVEITIA